MFYKTARGKGRGILGRSLNAVTEVEHPEKTKGAVNSCVNEHTAGHWKPLHIFWTDNLRHVSLSVPINLSESYTRLSPYAWNWSIRSSPAVGNGTDNALALLSQHDLRKPAWSVAKQFAYPWSTGLLDEIPVSRPVITDASFIESVTWSSLAYCTLLQLLSSSYSHISIIPRYTHCQSWSY
jgi:hypothetical protein